MDTRNNLEKAIENEQISIVTEILNQYPELINEFLGAYSALHLAVQTQNEELVKTILQAPNVNINIQTKKYLYTPAYFAITRCESNAILKLLIEKKADPNIRCYEGENCLKIASYCKKQKHIETLLQHPGMDIYAADNNGETAFEKAYNEGVKDIANLIGLSYLLELIEGFESSKKHSQLDKVRLDKLQKVLNEKPYKAIISVMQKFIGQNLDAIAAFNELNTSTSSYKDCPELNYFLAIFYRFGKGTTPNLGKACSFYYKSYQEIGKKLESKDNQSIVVYLNNFKEKIIASLESYFVSCTSIEDQYEIAKICFDIFLAEKNYNRCKTYLRFLEQNSFFLEKNPHFIPEKYYLISKETNDPADCEYPIKAKYGPALIDQAKNALNNTPANFTEAINYYFEAITTTNHAQEKAGIEGIEASLKQSPETLKAPEMMKKLIMFAIDLQFQQDKQDLFKSYCKAKFIRENILAQIVINSENIDLLIENLGRVLLGALAYHDKNINFNSLFLNGTDAIHFKDYEIPPSELASIKGIAEAILKDFLVINSTKEGLVVWIWLVLALSNSNPIQSQEFTKALEIDRNLAIKDLKSIKDSNFKAASVAKYLLNHQKEWPRVTKEPDAKHNNNFAEVKSSENDEPEKLYPDLHLYASASAPPSINPDSEPSHPELFKQVGELQKKMEHVIATLSETQQDFQKIKDELRLTQEKNQNLEKDNQELKKELNETDTKFKLFKAQRRIKTTMFHFHPSKEVIDINNNNNANNNNSKSV